MDDVATRLGRNMRTLREGRALTQAQMAKTANLPRATWANLESGAANPTLDESLRELEIKLMAEKSAQTTTSLRGPVPVFGKEISALLGQLKNP